MLATVRCSFLLAIILSLSNVSIAQPVDEGKLRDLLHLPMTNLALTYYFSTDGVLRAKMGDVEAGADAAKFKKSLSPKSDPALWQRLGDLYTQANDHAQSVDAAGHAAEIYAERLKSKPNDAQLWDDYACALMDADKEAEAEAAARKAVSLDSARWQFHATLGRVLAGEASTDIYGPRRNYETASSWKAVFSTNRPSPEKITSARRRLKEAASIYNKAVEIAPTDPQVYLKRAGYLATVSSGLGIVLDALSRPTAGKPVDVEAIGAQMASSLASPEELADTDRAAKLAPDNLQTVSYDAWLRVLGAMAKPSVANGSGDVWLRLPEAAKERIKARMADLSRIGSLPDKLQASKALSLLGTIQLAIVQDNSAAEQSLRQSLKLDSNNSEAYEAIFAVLTNQKAYADLILFAEVRLKSKDIARNHFLLAKAYDKANRVKDAVAQLDSAIALDPTDVLSIIGKANLLMKSNSDGSMKQAGELLVRAGELYRTTLEPDTYVALSVSTGIFYGLTDRPSGAREQLTNALEYDRNNETAKAALELVK